jgi:hypothetical protein
VLNYVRLLLAVVIASLIFKNYYLTLGILIGGSVSLLNFRSLSSSVQKVLVPRQSSAKVKIAYFFGFFSRLMVIALLTLSVFKLGTSGLIGFILGISLILVAITLTGIHQAIKERK